MPSVRPAGAARQFLIASSPPKAICKITDGSAVSYEPIPYGHHISRTSDLRLPDGLVDLERRYRQRTCLFCSAHPRTQPQRAVRVILLADPKRIIAVIMI